ncbi:MAG: TIGR04283 family arsenosugar biosynthesis glycosyltransferase [Synechococcaceae cyanobacterium]|nr:TIGR04283 family arsenosugar biosynthesis glycosyltransferase [Synechococcaceae cyanobacterium]
MGAALTPQRPPAPLSVVIPVRDEARGLPPLLADLAAAPELVAEVLVVDGGSQDGSATVARLAGARVLAAPPGRGGQLAQGVAASRSPWLLLLHGDGRLPRGWAPAVAAALGQGEGRAWAFRLAIDGADPALRVVELAVTLRSRWRSLPYGDQGLLLSRCLYERAGGIAPLPLMEDLEFVQRLRRLAPIQLLPGALRVSDRRWRRLGVWQTTLANARLRRDWRRGEAPERLAARYRRGA